MLKLAAKFARRKAWFINYIKFLPESSKFSCVCFLALITSSVWGYRAKQLPEWCFAIKPVTGCTNVLNQISWDWNQVLQTRDHSSPNC